MLALLFSLIVLGSLATSAALALGVLPGSPAVLAVVGGAHATLAWVFFRAYGRYRNLHRLVLRGRGELFDLAVSHLIATARTRGFRDHYRLRRCQGLVHTGDPLGALGALDQLRRHHRASPREQIADLAAAAQANLELGQVFWADRALTRARELGGEHHADVRAVAARLAHRAGDAATAADALRSLVRVRAFPFTRVVRARNLLWYGEALAGLGRPDEARRAFVLAHRAASESRYGVAAGGGRETP